MHFGKMKNRLEIGAYKSLLEAGIYEQPKDLLLSETMHGTL